MKSLLRVNIGIEFSRFLLAKFTENCCSKKWKHLLVGQVELTKKNKNSQTGIVFLRAKKCRLVALDFERQLI